MKFPLIYVCDKNTNEKPVLLGTNNHHILSINAAESLDFMNLQNGDTTGAHSGYCFANDPDDEDLLPLVPFETMMQAVKPHLNLSATDATQFDQAVTTINGIIESADRRENDRIKQLFNDTIDDYLKVIHKK